MRESPAPWIDTHVHVGAAAIEHPEALLRVLDEADADPRFVISPDVDLLEAMREDPDAMLAAARKIRDLTMRAPGRLFGGCCVNLNYPEAALRTMEVCFGEFGFVLLGEMLGYIFHFDMNTDIGERIVRKAAEYNVPVQIHLSTSNNPRQGHTSGMGQLEDILGIAERVPEAKYILAHMIGMVRDNPPVVRAYLDRIEERLGKWPENFWAEIIDFHSPGVREALARIPHERLIVGTDWCTRIGPPFPPYGVDHLVWFGGACPYRPSVPRLEEFLRQWGASDEDVRRIAFTNAAELLGLSSRGERESGDALLRNGK